MVYEDLRLHRDEKCLDMLKECLDYCSYHWITVFCELGGIDLLASVLKENVAVHHVESYGEDLEEAENRVQKCLMCMRALMN